jgi:hypothetical protein
MWNTVPSSVPTISRSDPILTMKWIVDLVDAAFENTATDRGPCTSFSHPDAQ